MAGAKKKKKGKRGGIRVVGQRESYMDTSINESWND